ncbi:MAG: hemerythrin domain-containing protein [Rudaea sp.]
MDEVGRAIRAHHAELARILRMQAEALAEGRESTNGQVLIEFLEKDLLPHARGEEASLYPLMDRLVRDHGQATATMSIDHEFIGDYIRRIEETCRALDSAPEGERPALRKELARLALRLEALFEVHLQKEERVYLPLLERYLTPEEQQRVLTGMHEA